MNLTNILEVQYENRKGITISAVSIKVVNLFETRKGYWSEVRGARCEGARCEVRGASCELREGGEQRAESIEKRE